MRILQFIIGMLLIFSFTSCEKVIDLKLKEAEERLVIEGYVTKGELEHRVRITKTLDFDVVSPYPAITDAIVTVEDDQGNVGTFAYESDGYYVVNNFAVESGRTYTLKVVHADNIYEAKSVVPSEILLDNVYILAYQFGESQIYLPIPKRQDIAGEKNYYSYQAFVNGQVVEGIRLQNDENADGMNNEQPVFVTGLEVGDTLRMIMHCIDYTAYKYLFTLSQNTGSVAAPANPVSNFGPKALGYFSARTSSEITKVIE